MDGIHIIRDVTYLPRPLAMSGRGPQALRESIGVELSKSEYYYEVAEFINLIEQGLLESRINSHQNSLVTLEIMDEIRRQIGVVYPADRQNDLSCD